MRKTPHPRTGREAAHPGETRTGAMRRWITAARRAVFSRLLTIRFGLIVAACAAASGMLAPAGAAASTGMSLELLPIGRAADVTSALYVDGGSVGGPCDDSRPAT